LYAAKQGSDQNYDNQDYSYSLAEVIRFYKQRARQERLNPKKYPSYIVCKKIAKEIRSGRKVFKLFKSIDEYTALLTVGKNLKRKEMKEAFGQIC